MKLLVIKIRIFILMLFAILLSLLFGSFYYLLYKYKLDSFGFKTDQGKINWNVDSFEFFYYSWLNQLTVGYSQYFPVSNFGKILSITQIFIFWIVVLSLSIIIDEENILKLHKIIF